GEGGIVEGDVAGVLEGRAPEGLGAAASCECVEEVAVKACSVRVVGGRGAGGGETASEPGKLRAQETPHAGERGGDDHTDGEEGDDRHEGPRSAGGARVAEAVHEILDG